MDLNAPVYIPREFTERLCNLCDIWLGEVKKDLKYPILEYERILKIMNCSPESISDPVKQIKLSPGYIYLELKDLQFLSVGDLSSVFGEYFLQPGMFNVDPKKSSGDLLFLRRGKRLRTCDMFVKLADEQVRTKIKENSDVAIEGNLCAMGENQSLLQSNLVKNAYISVISMRLNINPFHPSIYQ